MHRLLLCSALVLAVPGCAETPTTADAAVPRDAPLPDGLALDGGGLDAAGADAPGTDAPGTDARAPEVCSGGVDEDGDRLTDCEDSDCWSVDVCIDLDVGRMAPGAVRCGDPIVLDATETRAACGTIGGPDPVDYPTDCSVGTLTVNAHLYCVGGASAALWIEERVSTPRTSVMVTPRRFDQTSYERAAILDWERHTSGASSTSGATSFPVHDGVDFEPRETSNFRTITIRPVLPGDSISRLMGLSFIMSVVDLDTAMSTDTRRPLRTGGLVIAIP